PFADPPIRAVPEAWLAGLPPALVVAVHVAVLAGPAAAPGTGAEAAAPPVDLALHFASDNVAGSLVSGSTAAVWTDFVIRDDGFSRMLVIDLGLRARQAGRLVQRLLEI